MQQTEIKKCRKCGVPKSLSKFPKSTHSSNKISVCIECKAAREKRRRNDVKERSLALPI